MVAREDFTPARRRRSAVMRSRARRRSVSICDSPGPRAPMPGCAALAPRRSRCVHRPRMRARLYSSWASSTCSLPSALLACPAKMSRITVVRSTTGRSSAASRLRSWRGESSSSQATTLASAAFAAALTSSTLPGPRYVLGWGRSRCWTAWPTTATPAVRSSSSQLAQVVTGFERGDAERALFGAARALFGAGAGSLRPAVTGSLHEPSLEGSQALPLRRVSASMCSPEESSSRSAKAT